ncbi:MAG: hypothetical protein Hals2KO_31290 [Halioglobus sp.]
MLKENLHQFLFLGFAIGLPLWAMDNNSFDKGSVHSCYGECYEAWQQETGGVLEVAMAKAEAKAAASPEELGAAAYAGCIACHGAQGEGGIGPKLAGQSSDDIYGKLLQYKNGETVGNQSALMWGQAAMLGDDDMKNIAAFVETLP